MNLHAIDKDKLDGLMKKYTKENGTTSSPTLTVYGLLDCLVPLPGFLTAEKCDATYDEKGVHLPEKCKWSKDCSTSCPYASMPDHPKSTVEKCECECHKPIVKRANYAHSTVCCDEMNGFVGKPTEKCYCRCGYHDKTILGPTVCICTEKCLEESGRIEPQEKHTPEEVIELLRKAGESIGYELFFQEVSITTDKTTIKIIGNPTSRRCIICIYCKSIISIHKEPMKHLDEIIFFALILFLVALVMLLGGNRYI